MSRAWLLLLLAGCGGAHTDDSDDVEPTRPAEVRWLAVVASDYDLVLVPDFDAAVLSYTAQADGPGIVVFAEVLLTADVAGVRINGEPAVPSGFRTWSTDPEAGAAAPTQLVVEVEPLEGPAPPTYTVDVTVP